jgi:hypothetical protein
MWREGKKKARGGGVGRKLYVISMRTGYALKGGLPGALHFQCEGGYRHVRTYTKRGNSRKPFDKLASCIIIFPTNYNL